MSIAGSVPPWLVGVWERRYIRRSDVPNAPDAIEQLGAEDSSVTVRYLQTPRLFFDIRVPAARPAGKLGPGGGEGASLEELRSLLGTGSGDAFTGLTEVWKRDNGEERVHWHAAFGSWPVSDSAKLWAKIDCGRHTTEDIGRVEHQESGRWFEWGCGDSTFVEEWVSIDEGAGERHCALRRAGGMLVVVGDWFGFVDDHRPAAAAPAADVGFAEYLADDSVSLEDKRRLAAGAEYSTGRVSEGWRITLSTLPWRDGECLGILALFAGGGAAGGGWEQVGAAKGMPDELTEAALVALGSQPAPGAASSTAQL
eukprot:SAG22_NODE_2624_length_2363_cov_18.147527_1_plen_311_part_00